jgi:primase-polymerase (primpol)-like protein
MTLVKPHTYVADISNLPRALQHLTSLNRWVVWRWEKITRKNGSEKWTKPPYQARRPNAKARSNNPGTWSDYKTAVRAVEAGLADGIGIMLKDSEVAAADLDRVRDARTGDLVSWAKQLCVEADQLGLYREVTVSGSGLRFIGSALGNELHRKFTFNRKTGAGIELYRNTARYITISGLQENSSENLGPIERADRRRTQQVSERHRREICHPLARRGDALVRQVAGAMPGQCDRIRAGGCCRFGDKCALAADQGDSERTAARYQ